MLPTPSGRIFSRAADPACPARRHDRATDPVPILATARENWLADAHGKRQKITIRNDTP